MKGGIFLFMDIIVVYNNAPRAWTFKKQDILINKTKKISSTPSQYYFMLQNIHHSLSLWTTHNLYFRSSWLCHRVNMYIRITVLVYWRVKAMVHNHWARARNKLTRSSRPEWLI